MFARARHYYIDWHWWLKKGVMIKKGWSGNPRVPRLPKSPSGWSGMGSLLGFQVNGASAFSINWYLRLGGWNQKSKGLAFQERWGSWMMNWLENLLPLWVWATENQFMGWTQWQFLCWVELGESRLKFSGVSDNANGIGRQRSRKVRLSRIRWLDLINLEFLSSPWEEQERSKNRWSPRHGRTRHVEMLVGLDLLFKFLMSIQWVAPNEPFAPFRPSCPKWTVSAIKAGNKKGDIN